MSDRSEVERIDGGVIFRFLSFSVLLMTVLVGSAVFPMAVISWMKSQPEPTALQAVVALPAAIAPLLGLVTAFVLAATMSDVGYEA